MKLLQLILTAIAVITWTPTPYTHAAGLWQVGTFTNNDATTLQFSGDVCVDVISAPSPDCGWKMDLWFFPGLAGAPTVHGAILNQIVSMGSLSSWFEYTNTWNTGNLSYTGAPQCVSIGVHGTWSTSYFSNTFEARMTCVCLLV